MVGRHVCGVLENLQKEKRERDACSSGLERGRIYGTNNGAQRPGTETTRNRDQ
jgi:hypothetical protein